MFNGKILDMLSQKFKCSYCGAPIPAGSTAGVYSIRVDGKGYLLEILDGELAPDSLHYCSQNCMFKREQGVIPKDTILDFMGLPCEAP